MSTWPKPTVETLPDQVARLILQRIASGELHVGERLPAQRDLAQSLGVGLAVVREAVKRLEALSVIETTHGSGTVIRPFRWIPLIFDESLFCLAVQRIGVQDLWEARRLIEGQIIRLAAQRRTESNLEAMRDVLVKADPLPKDYATSQALNREFHLALARAGQNRVLEDLLAPLLDVQVEGVAHRFSAEQCRRTWRAHWAIFGAVAAGSLKASATAIERHFKIGPIALEEIGARSRPESESLADGVSSPRRRRSKRVS